MLITLLPFLLTFLPLATSVPNLLSPPTLLRASKTCPVRLPVHDSSPRIVGGAYSNYYIQSHIISFYDEGCAGTLISPEWALTAAHCLVKPSSKAYVAGAVADSGTLVTIKAVYSHPGFALPVNDIALVKFEKQLPSHCRFIRINDSPHIPSVNEYARVAGFGYTDEGFNPAHDSKLRQVDVPVVDTKDCKHAYRDVDSFLQSGISPNMHICAGYQEGGCDSCSADSGGPLFVYDSQRDLVQIALVSFGYGCARAGVPGGYTRLSNYISWMRSVGAQFNTTSSRTAVMMHSAPEPDSHPVTTAPSSTDLTNDQSTTTSPPTSTSQHIPEAPQPPPVQTPQTNPSTPPLIPDPTPAATPVSATMEEQPTSSATFPHSPPAPTTTSAPDPSPVSTPAADPPVVPQPSAVATGPPTPAADGPPTTVNQPVGQPDATPPSTATTANGDDDDIEMTPSREPQGFSSPPGADLSATQGAKDSTTNVGAIAGGTVGAVALVIFIIAAVVFVRRRYTPAVTSPAV
ncbi:Mite allergen Der p 3 [Gracilariopsis chorda]|uniref:Mite allergen Der p 3 n=1 Tax=Gracilariopsis chorda TaxID=448386 RepID=A0A2V3J4X2_9FLOR|nr:Mite allergen Der p 3 [Gracilariopsis chorda]|eukprot:PXF49172.1 Mite allergen Der p 3 [Gracilariopsis chorda]